MKANTELKITCHKEQNILKNSTIPPLFRKNKALKSFTKE
jgi:hypothetical protein